MASATLLWILVACGAIEAGPAPLAPPSGTGTEVVRDAGEETEEETPEERLTSAFETLAVEDDPDTAAEVIEMLGSEEPKDEAWRAFLNEYYETHPLTGMHLEFWNYALAQTRGEYQGRVALMSGLAAAAALREGLAELKSGGEASESLALAIAWLQDTGLDQSIVNRERIFGALERAFTMYWRGGQGTAPSQPPPLWLDLCVAVRRSMPPHPRAAQAAATMLGMEDAIRTFWLETGILLFDNEALTAPQLVSLTSLVLSVPHELHLLDVIIVPGQPGLGPGGAAFRATVRPMYIEPIPIDARSSPDTFPAHQPARIAPQFTVAAAREFTRAVQRLQFALRPELAARSEDILRRSDPNKTSYLRQDIAPERFHRNVDDFLPLNGAICILDTEIALRHASDMFDIGYPQPMDTFLLFLDLMSGGSGTSFEFATAPDGIVRSSPTPVQHAAMPGPAGTVPGPISSARLIGLHWTFQFDNAGRTTAVRYTP